MERGVDATDPEGVLTGTPGSDRSRGDPGWLAAAVADVIPPAVVVVDGSGRPVWANRSWETLTGGGRNPDGRWGLARAVAAGPLLPAVRKAVGGTATRIDGVLLDAADGRIIEREAWVGPLDTVPSSDGGPLVAVVVPPEEERLHPLLAHTHDIITVLAADGTIRYSNPAAGRLLGTGEQVLAGTSAFERIHPEDRDRAVAALTELLAGGDPHQPIELRLRWGDGSWHHCLVHAANLLEHPAVRGVVVTVHDITDVVTARAERDRTARRLTSIVEHLSDVIVIIGPDRTVRWASPSIERIIGAPDHTNVGMDALGDVHPDDVDEVRRRLEACMATPGGSDRLEFRLHRDSDDQWRWVDAIIINRIDDPAVGGVVATLRDVTDLRRALETERAAADELRRADALKDEFLTTVSHELRTPLAAIRGFASLLARGGLDPAETARVIERLDANAAQLHEMVEHILDFSRIEAGRARIDPVPVPPGDLVADAVDRYRDALASHVVTVDVEPCPPVMADPVAVRHVLGNLLTNAAKAGPAGSRVTVAARVTPGSPEVELSVSDEGPGVPAADRERIFERFERRSLREADRGAGVGLAIARGYVELHGGRIGVDEAPGGGARFWFTLPVADAPDA